MKKKAQQKKPKAAKPRRKTPAKKAATKRGAKALLTGVGDVEIEIKDCQSQFEGEYVYSVVVRAKVTLPEGDCEMQMCEAEVYTDPSFPDNYGMNPELSSPGWYTTGVFEVFGAEPGDVFSAKVTAYWMCLDSNSRTESAQLPPCS